MARTHYLGLDMDITMVPKIVAACRGLYPDLVQPGDSDNRAVQLVLHRIISEHLAAWAVRSAADPVAAAQQATDDAVAEQQAADDAARVDAADIAPTATT